MLVVITLPHVGWAAAADALDAGAVETTTAPTVTAAVLASVRKGLRE
jgi:hypothetical protein